jgi:Protein of unknown function (DUF2442)
MRRLVRVVEAKAIDDCRLWLRFSDGYEGVRDLSDVLSEGGVMVEPLRDPAVFKRVFVESGVPSWPNGFDLDAINLHMELDRAGLLIKSEPEFETDGVAGRAALRAEE